MVLTPLTISELETIFDNTGVKVLKYCLIKSMFSQPEIKPKQDEVPYQIAKEHIEQWMVQALDAKPTGSGSYPIDIYKMNNNWGADVKMLGVKIDKVGNFKVGESGETSLAQKFKETGSDLDTLFKEKQYSTAVNGWISIVSNKLKQVKEELGLHNIYYFFFLRAGWSFYLCGLRVNNEMLQYVKPSSKITETNIWTDNYIDERYGSVRLYKSKKRLELRLSPLNWKKDGLLMLIHSKNSTVTSNLREVVQDEDELKKHLNKQLLDIFK
jgi:hypothetical protein